MHRKSNHLCTSCSKRASVHALGSRALKSTSQVVQPIRTWLVTKATSNDSPKDFRSVVPSVVAKASTGTYAPSLGRRQVHCAILVAHGESTSSGDFEMNSLAAVLDQDVMHVGLTDSQGFPGRYPIAIASIQTQVWHSITQIASGQQNRLQILVEAHHPQCLKQHQNMRELQHISATSVVRR
jgi:hypothetical protein